MNGEITSLNTGKLLNNLSLNAVVLNMKKKGVLLLVSFITFYTLVHGIRHLPELLHGELYWNGETTYILSVMRIAADIGIAFLFALFSYLLFFYYYPKKKFTYLAAGLLSALCFCFILGFWWTSFMERVPVRLSNYLPQAVFFYMMDAVFGVAFYFIRYSRFKELQETAAQLQTRQAELSFLRSQINPHFLFNNLNNIYALVFYKNEQALTAIAGLSDLLRYMLYDTTEMVELSKEVIYIEKYIALQQLRYERPEPVSFSIAGKTDDLLIPPLIFIPFVENAFKHGDCSAPDCLHISLSATLRRISFSCSNKKTEKRTDPGGGIGIENIKRRLALLYPGKHNLDIKETGKLFTVNMELYDGE